MKRNFGIFFILLCLIGINNLNAQKKDKSFDIQYRRSSLCEILIESEDFPQKTSVIEAYTKAPFPDKYNDHCIGINSFDPNEYSYSGNEKDLTKSIDQFIQSNKIANKLISKWFNRQADGCFDMKLVGERGYYNATEMEAKIAAGNIRGAAILKDAGEELIKNTFVIFSKMNFISNEPIARVTRDEVYFHQKELRSKAYEEAKSQYSKSLTEARKIEPELLSKLAIKAAEKLYKKTKKSINSSYDIAIGLADREYEKAKQGYFVFTTSYLYKLKWDEEVADKFYTQLWVDKSSFDAEKISSFNNADVFELDYVGKESSKSWVPPSLKELLPVNEDIEKSTIRNIDAVYSKLQKKFEVFKPKTPILSVNPITAKIGMKEGLEGGEKFEVLEQYVDSETGLTKYRKKGEIKVNKSKVWDNRYNAYEDNVDNSELSGTEFTGGKKYYPGMLIRLLR